MCERARTAAGSITVFVSLTLLLAASFLLTLLEAARVKGLEAYSQMYRTNAMEAVLSEYDFDIFARYGIFLLDGGYGSGALQVSEINRRLQESCQRNGMPGTSGEGLRAEQNFYQMRCAEAAVSHYLLATDASGAPFRKMAAASMKLRYPAALLEELAAGFKNAEASLEQAQQSQSALEQAQQQIADAKKQQTEQAQTGVSSEAAAQPEESTGSKHPPENPMELVKKLKNTDLLTLVLPDGARVSEKGLGDYQMLERRRLLQGNEPFETDGALAETVLYQKFLQTQFGCFTAQKGGALDYELEYIQAGKTTDRANLKSVVRKLLLLREGANFLYLQGDGAKRAQAKELALLLSAAVGIAPAAGAIAQGILAAWAYVESILDVRTLLTGGKVPLTKTSASWRSDLTALASSLTDSSQTGAQEGEDYAGYVQKLIYLKSQKEQNYRAMDLIALYKQRQCGGSVQMDAMLLSLRAELSCEAEPVFLDWVTLLSHKPDCLAFSEEVYGSYLP